MKKSIILSSLLLYGCQPASDPPSPATNASTPVTIFAASSLKEAVGEIAEAWTQQSGQPTRLQFDASSTLARQIKEGAPADVFITAAPEWLDQVKTLDRYDWLSNRLVLVAGKDSGSVDLKQLESLSLGNEQVPAGKYAKAALEKLGVPVPERTIYGANVRDVLTKVSQGGCQAGIVYATDAAVDPGVRAVYTFPADSHPKILYSVGRLTPSGEAFARVLREPASLEIAKKRGFELVP
jgi:molybdate transport system substrate-binding protein